MVNTDFLSQLNENQRKAVTSPRQPLLILAGPGTGKTRTLISRIIYNIQHFNIPADQILALTFSNKAALEMKQRLELELGEEARKPYLGTFHSFCLSILRKYHEVAGLEKHFSVCDDSYQQRLVENLLSTRTKDNVTKKARGILLAFSNFQLKEKSLPPFSGGIFDEYKAHLKKYKLVDYDQIILYTKNLFRDNSDILAQYQFLYQAIHVDEFQDTDPVQYQLLHDLAIKHRHIFVVADDDQSIYAWRGAHPENIRQYMKDFHIDHPVILNQNYRSGPLIMDTAQLIVEETDRIQTDKEIISQKDMASEINAIFFKDESQELKYIYKKIIDWKNNHKIPYNQIAILYPRHIFGEKLADLLLKNRLPYQLVKGKNLAEHPLTKTLILYLKLIREPADTLILEELSEIELGYHDFKQVHGYMKSQQLTFRAALQQFSVRPEISYKLRHKIGTFIGHIANLVNLKGFFSFDGLINEIIKGSKEITHSVLGHNASKLSDYVCSRFDRLHNTDVRIWIYHEDERIAYIARSLLEAVFGRRIHYLAHDGMEQVNKNDIALLLGPFISGNISCTVESLFAQVSPARKGSLSNVFRWIQTQIHSDSKAIFNNYVVFDLETTSKEPDRCGIVEIAAIKIVNGEIVDEFQTLVNPEIPIEPEAEAIHKISNLDVQKAPAITDVWDDFIHFIGDFLIIAHNGYHFDFKIMDRTARFLKKQRIKNTRYDSLILARNLFSGQQNSIDALAERFKVDAGTRHRALDDVKALHYIFQKLLSTNDRRDVKSLGEEFTEYVCLGNIVENQLTTKEDKILYMAGISKLLSPYSKILPSYIKKFSLTAETYKSGISAQAERIWPTLKIYASDEAFLRRIMEMSMEFKSLSVDLAIAEFLSYLSLLNPQDQLTAIDAISLLTLHSAKGLEFERVIIMGMEDDNIPSFFAYQTDGDDDRPVSKKIEEQKRLLYVGMTRARKEVIFTVVKNRFGRKQKSSPFLEDLKDNININYYQ